MTPQPSEEERKRSAEDFIFGKVIGEGSFSTVYLAKDVHTNKEYAIKVLEKRHIKRERKTEYVLREKKVLQILGSCSTFFVRLYCTFQDSERLYFVLTYAKNGELLSHLNKSGSFSLECSQYYAAELLLALEVLHSKGIIHRDLKPENILFDENWHILITDFGSAKIVDGEENNKEESEETKRRKNSFVQKERRLRRRTNYYIVSLAAADFLVGLLGIPFAILSSIGLPTNLHACLFTVSLLVVLCTISIFCLVAVSIDRYWAILYPMGYSRNVRTKTALVIISVCWFAGSLIGFLPLLGWHSRDTPFQHCFFVDVMDYSYLVFLYFGTIITPAVLLAAFYAHIYRVVLKQLRHIVTMNPEKGSAGSGGTMLRMLGAAQKREVKATQNLAIIVLFFMICWIPLYTINCILAFCHDCEVDSTFTNFCIILSHLNSAGNPLLYAYHLRDFRAALKNFLCGLFSDGPLRPIQTTKFKNSLQTNGNFNIHRTLRHTRSALNLANQSNFVDSPLTFRTKSLSMHLPMPPKLSLISASTALTLTENDDIGARIKTEMWNIPELPSYSEESPVAVLDTFKENPNAVCKQDSAFYDYNEDVFIDDAALITESCQISLKPIGHVQSRPLIDSSLTASPQICRKLFLVEAEVNNFNSTSYKCTKSCSAMDDIGHEVVNSLNLTGSDDLISGSIQHLSPFRTVGELFLQVKRSRSFSGGSNMSSDSVIKDCVNVRKNESLSSDH